MIENICADIAGLKLHFLTEKPKIAAVLLRDLKPFLVQGTSKSQSFEKITISLLQNEFRGFKNPDLKTSQVLRIKRNDFISSTKGNSTALSIVPNKYSVNSWLRIFLTQRALRNNSFFVHSSALHENNSAYIFAGVSGSGKSTIARKMGLKDILSDELACVYKQHNCFYAASTPFWGELKRCSNNIFKSQVRSIFFIKHGSKISKKRLLPAKSLSKLMKCILFFSKDTASMKKLFAIACGFCETVPAYELSFALSSTKKELLTAIEGGGSLL
jgi:hypothetical protein